MKNKYPGWAALAGISLFLSACSKDDGDMNMPSSATITIENVLDSRPLVESGLFKNGGASPVVMPGESISIQFSAGKGQAVSFATMYGWSNDLFFAPANPGIKVFKDDGTPVEGDVSGQIKLWDNGTRINQSPGAMVAHPGTAESTPKNVTEVNGTDSQGNTYAPAPSLMKASLHYNGNSIFTLTITNTSGNTTNPTPFSPGVWAVSYIAGGNLLSPTPLYDPTKPSANGLTNLAEMGDNSVLGNYISGQTGIFTPLSPVLVVVYNGIDNPIYKTGQMDAGKGLKKLAQTGDASDLAAYLKTVQGVKNVYILAASGSTVLLPKIGNQAGSKVSQQLSVTSGDRVAIATMYGLSNDWFFASKGNGADAMQKGDISGTIGLFDNGTALNQFPGAGVNQVNMGGTPQPDSKNIEEVPNPNAFTTLPAISGIMKVTMQ
ncbi:spondin domain-containing protein [Chitinophaga qingshengii]|uniref:Spondin domain-containing protein n=1 Tax=Chitinophaga qingshengii TaxID=1569794 RepID=A0ABR7TXU0_9BACT|nr:spondin domain-containing protein [Chitinophaga qingshengii]MBC9934950.1 spondin domain-containing protein [Chitinophaga qingshengii]